MIVAIGEIYKITYPNGKIYIGQDRTHDINYFGSANSELIERDFSEVQRKSITVTKEIIITRKNIELRELNRLEREQIKKHDSDNPNIGYNRNRRKKCA